MSIDEFIRAMNDIGLEPSQINYLLDLDALRQASGMYSDLDALAGLILVLINGPVVTDRCMDPSPYHPAHRLTHAHCELPKGHEGDHECAVEDDLALVWPDAAAKEQDEQPTN